MIQDFSYISLMNTLNKIITQLRDNKGNNSFKNTESRIFTGHCMFFYKLNNF